MHKRSIKVDDRWHADRAYQLEAEYGRSGEFPSEMAAWAEHKRVSLLSIGEFGGIMEEIFDSSRRAVFHWDRWQVIGGIRTAVLTYEVTPEFSRYSVCAREESDKDLGSCRIAGHRGFVFVEPESGTVERLILIATGLTGEVYGAGHVLDYGPASISGRRYTLPVRSIAYMRIGQYETREEIEYRNHRKFTADSVVNFAADPAH